MKSKKCFTMTNLSAPPHCSWYSLYDSNSQFSLWRNFKMLDPIRSHLIYWANLNVLFAECLHMLLLSVTAWTQNWRESRISDESPPDRPHYPLCWITWPQPWWRLQCLQHWIYVSSSCFLKLSLQCQQHIYGSAEI